MPTKIYLPLDTTPYLPDPNSRIADQTVADGDYVYVHNLAGVIHLAPDGPHQHPKILGGGQAVRYAGDVRIRRGLVIDITNLSGTFCCDDPVGLLAAVKQFAQQGLGSQVNSIRFFPSNGSKPVILG